jgi:hypothetical protein
MNCINDILQEIQNFKEKYKNKECEIVYRAFSNKNIKDISEEKPSLFLKNLTEKEKEKEIYNEFIATKPDEFLNMSTFDKLTKMRHYNIPNRLLDVTFDPLCALYFAVGNTKHEGSMKIFIYVVDKDYIKNFDSDTVTVLSALTKLNHKDKLLLKFIVDLFKEYEGEKNEKNFSRSNLKKIQEAIKQKYPKIHDTKDSNIVEILNNKTEEMLPEKTKTSKLFNLFPFNLFPCNKEITPNELFNIFVSVYVHELNWQLKKEIPGWYENVLDISTFTHCYLVKANQNNPRIVAQSGAFFIYPFEDTDIGDSLLDNNTICNFNIKEELKALNIKSSKYFCDDLNVYAEEITEKYIEIGKKENV